MEEYGSTFHGFTTKSECKFDFSSKVKYERKSKLTVFAPFSCYKLHRGVLLGGKKENLLLFCSVN